MCSMSSGKYLNGLSGLVDLLSFVFIRVLHTAITSCAPMKHKAAREARLTESGVLHFLHRLPRAMRREVVTAVLVRPLVTESGERVDRLINETSVGIGILEDIE